MKAEQRRRAKEDKGRDSEAVVDTEAPQQSPTKHGISFPKLFVKTKERDVHVPSATTTTAATATAATATAATATAATPPVVTPPAATPPAATTPTATTPTATATAATLPVGTPPVGTPPVSTPPVSTPPAAHPPAAHAPTVQPPVATTATATATTPEVSPTSEEEPSSPPSKMKNWLNRLTRPRAKTSNAVPEENARKRGFIGGAALTKMRNQNASTSSIDNRSTSMHEVAMAGRDYELGPGIQLMDKDHSLDKEISPDGHVVAGNEVSPNEEVSPDAELGEPSTSNARGRERDPSLARSVSSLSTNDKFVEARSELSLPVSTPRVIKDPASGRGSPVRESRFSEILE